MSTGSSSDCGELHDRSTRGWKRLLPAYSNRRLSKRNSKKRGTSERRDSSANAIVELLMKKQPESGFPSHISSRKLKQALSLLPHLDQEILLMRFLDQLGNDEIQDVLGISESEARLRIRKALQKLQTILEQA